MLLPENQATWTLAEKVAFRFCCLFFCLFVFTIPYFSEWLTVLFGRAFFGLTISEGEMTGSGDSLYDWVSVFTNLVIALLGTVLWSLLDRQRPSYNQAKYFLDLLVRYFLIVNMFVYGFSKVFVGQMSAPTDGRLWQRVGDMSPMGMLWTFIGSSAPYQIFCGTTEVLAGFLLFFRRTLLLGSLVAMGVMLQVFVLNMCYDVPVKIFSFFLFCSALYVSAPFANNIFAFFIQNKSTEPHQFFEVTDKKWFHNAGLALKIIFLGFIGFQIFQEMQGEEEAESLAVDGAYLVTSASRQIDTSVWTLVNIRSNYNIFSAQNEETAFRNRWNMEVNDTTKTLIISSLKNKDSVIAALNYRQTDSAHLNINGLWSGDSLTLNLTRLPKRQFLLVTRGFHWVNNEPFNR